MSQIISTSSNTKSNKTPPQARGKVPNIWDITAYRRHLARLVCGYCGRPARVTVRGNPRLLYCECASGEREAGLWIDRERWREKHGDIILEDSTTKKSRKRKTRKTAETNKGDA